MSNLNPLAVQKSDIALSRNGNVQWVNPDIEQFFKVVVSTLYGKDSFYSTTDENMVVAKKCMDDIITTNALEGIEYIGRVLLFARKKMFIRTIPIALVVELAAALHRANMHWTGMRNLTSSVIQRTDEITDMFAYAEQVFGSKNKIPRALLKGIGDAFNKFDTYQFGKYNDLSKSKTFKKVINVVHPVPKNETQSILFKQIIDGSLPVPYTWEVVKSRNGKLPKDQQLSECDIWTELINRRGTGYMNYMALLRNLRNINKAKVDDATLQQVADRISDLYEVNNSKLLPWSFINAHQVGKDSGFHKDLLNAIEKAIEYSVDNVPSVGKNVWIILDCSLSMSDHPSNIKGTFDNTPIKIGAIFAAALYKAMTRFYPDGNVVLSMFSNDAEIVKLNKQDSVINMYQYIMSKAYGGGTCLRAALEQKSKLGFEPDTVVVLSDMQVNELDKKAFKNQKPINIGAMFKKDCSLIAVDLSTSVSTPLRKDDGWVQLSGWTENIFKYLEYAKQSKSLAQALFDNTFEFNDPDDYRYSHLQLQT